jgi:hypothetical protein
MYKITIGASTMVGCNEDAWRTTSRIWFETAKDKSEYGVAFTGSRQVGQNRYVPQSGMNEAGLTFSRLASTFPGRDIGAIDKKEIVDEVTYLSEIMHECATVEDVRQYIEQYDHSFFKNDVFIYVESSGKYLIIEPYDCIEGNEPQYVLSNFCPSITDNQKARRIERYRNGEDFLRDNDIEASLAFCTAVSDTMHVCRDRNGDGTLLTSIWDTQNGLVNLFFYHSFGTTVQFNITEELDKGDHILNIASLFPVNPEFERLSSYITPFNWPFLRILLVILGGLLTIISLVFIRVLVRDRKTGNPYGIIMAASFLSLLLTTYFVVLITNIGIYYFDAPFRHFNSNFISIFSYLPLMLLLLIVPIMFFTIRFLKNERERSWVKGLLIVTNLIYICSIVGFGYWGLFNVLI